MLVELVVLECARSVGVVVSSRISTSSGVCTPGSTFAAADGLRKSAEAVMDIFASQNSQVSAGQSEEVRGDEEATSAAHRGAVNEVPSRARGSRSSGGSGQNQAAQADCKAHSADAPRPI